MKKILFLAFAMATSPLILLAQKNYAATDAFVEKLGALPNLNVATIADTLTEQFADKQEKARAIYYWIANNIQLDPKATRSNDNRKTDPVDVVQMRRTTPLGFSLLVQEMCSMANIRCLSIDGFVKNNAEDIGNKADDINHSWNVVQLGQSPEQWFYIDAAKASGFIDPKTKSFTKLFTSEYFFAERSLFNLDHYPDNEAWQLGAGPKSVKEFYALPVIHNTAYSLGLQKPEPRNGYIKTKSKTAVKFGFVYNGSFPIKNIFLHIGQEKKQVKPEPANFTDNGGTIAFSYQFKNADVYPVKIVADGKDLMQYYIESEE